MNKAINSEKNNALFWFRGVISYLVIICDIYSTQLFDLEYKTICIDDSLQHNTETSINSNKIVDLFYFKILYPFLSIYII